MRNTRKPSIVTIIIPVYNGERFLKEAIESALAQTYPNCEVIVVDDGSTDATESVAGIFGDNIRYIKKANGGVSSALNLGIRKAKGEYISWLSHDDVYAPEKIETQLKVANNNTICFSNYTIINEFSQVIEICPIHEVHDVKKFACHLYPVVKGLIFGCTLLVPKRCFDEYGLFDEALRTSQDYDMWLRLFPKYDIAFQPDYLMYSRRHSGQGSFSQRALDESNTFWIRLMKTIRDEDKIAIDGSVENFYYCLYKQMQRVGYGQAAEYAKRFVTNNLMRDLLHMPFMAKVRRVMRKLM